MAAAGKTEQTGKKRKLHAGFCQYRKCTGAPCVYTSCKLSAWKSGSLTAKIELNEVSCFDHLVEFVIMKRDRVRERVRKS